MLPSLLLVPTEAPWFGNNTNNINSNWSVGLKGGDLRGCEVDGIGDTSNNIFVEAKSELLSFSSAELSCSSLSDGTSSGTRAKRGALAQDTGGGALNSSHSHGVRLPAMTLSNLTSASGEASVSSGTRGDASTVPPASGGQSNNPATPATPSTTTNTTASGQPGVKRKRNLPGTPDPDAEVIALSPKTLMATNRFVCEICNKGFQRDQNLQLHRRGHNLPWKLRQRTSKEIRKRVYICPEPTCVHHEPSRALGDLTGIKKHFCRKHGEKKWKCDKCSKRYAVQSDWKAHSKTCGTREYRCDCGTLFSRRDSFITHRAFCDALAEESARVSAGKPGQGPGDHTMGAGPSGTGMTVMGAPQSPRSQAVGRIGAGQMDPLSANTPPRPGLPGNFPGMGMGDGGISMPPARWGQPGPGSGPTTPGTGTRLSLWSGPGPGPPGLMGPQLQLGGNSQMNPMDANSQFLMQPPKSLHGSGVSNMMGSSDFDIPQAPRPSGGMIQIPPSGPGSIFANLFASGGGLPGMQQSGPGQSGGNMQMGNMSGGFSDFTGGAPTRLERGGSGAAGLTLSSSAGMTSSSSAANNNAGTGPSVSSILNQQQHTATSQMSATALLQKAAQMGASASNSSLLRGFVMGGGPGGQGGSGQGGQGGGTDNSSIALGALWQGSNRQDQGRAGSLPPISSGIPHQMLRRPADPSPGSQGIGSSLPPTAFGGSQGRTNDHQDFMNSLTQYGSGGMSNLPPMYPNPLGNSGNLGGMMPQTSPMQHRMQGGNDNLGQQQQHQQQQQQQQQQQHNMHGGSQPQGMPQSMIPGIPKSEDGGDRFTRDFLGVGPTANMPGRTISQRELASIAPLGPGGVEMSFNNQQRSAGPSGQPSPGKSWDGS